MCAQFCAQPKSTSILVLSRPKRVAGRGALEGKQTKQMEWTRSETLALAQQSCTFCHGLGLRPGRAGSSAPCNCVFRAVFRACYARFIKCTSKEKYVSRVSLEANPGRLRKSVWGLKNEEFVADFCLVSRRVLDEQQYRLFKFHFLLGADWKLCCRRLNLDRGEFFHEAYRIQQRLGRAFRELEPYALYPVDEYFAGSTKEKTQPAKLFPVETEKPSHAKPVLNFPVRRAA